MCTACTVRLRPFGFGGGGWGPVIMSIIRSSEKPTTTATITSKCAVQSHKIKIKKGWGVDYLLGSDVDDLLEEIEVLGGELHPGEVRNVGGGLEKVARGKVLQDGWFRASDVKRVPTQRISVGQGQTASRGGAPSATCALQHASAARGGNEEMVARRVGNVAEIRP